MSNHINTDLLGQLGLSRQSKADARDPGKVGQDQFLELMLTQLQNQDPFNPMESGEFLTQIAQFTMASGISDLNNSFAQVSDTIRSNQVLQASTLVGRSVLVEGTQLDGKTQAWLSESGLGGAVELPQAATSLSVDVYDPYGQLVRKLDFGSQPAGMNYFTWDGLDAEGNPLPQGEYQLSASARFGGESEALDLMVMDQVISVSIGASGTDYTVNLSGTGDTQVSQIRQIL